MDILALLQALLLSLGLSGDVNTQAPGLEPADAPVLRSAPVTSPTDSTANARSGRRDGTSISNGF